MERLPLVREGPSANGRDFPNTRQYEWRIYTALYFGTAWNAPLPLQYSYFGGAYEI